MNDPPTNERFQFGIRTLLIYTFGMAAWFSLFKSYSLGAVLTAWFLLLLFLLYFRDSWSFFIHVFGLFFMFLVGLLSMGRSAAFLEELLIVGGRFCGIVSFVAYNFFLLVNLSEPSTAANDNVLCTIGKCPHCDTPLRAERPKHPVEVNCPNCGEKSIINPKLSSSLGLFYIFIAMGSILFLIYRLLPVLH